MFHHIIHKSSVQYGLPVIRAVYEMDHAEINVACMEAGQKIIKGFLNGRNIPHAEITAVFPCRAQMALNDPFLPVSLNGIAQVRTDVGLRHEAIQHVDACLAGGVHHGKDLGLAFSLQPLSSKGYLTDGQACVTKISILHGRFSRFLKNYIPRIIPYFSLYCK